ncbi:unnamed protein product [Miscanthus lutarioriparius]|uniref:NB-ARC domain-containing protein n=1 Tax=Miscanthus lutarioriparius TaxID=422564 RepID=A0A811QEL4_9POAL|nr:unnamed protein product [Miscanthus lutarioriparius]
MSLRPRCLRGLILLSLYFIVVDDVWDVETCKTINFALIGNCCGSKVITTTRKFDVAEEAGEVYKLKPLSYENSKKLLYTRIFGADRQYHDNKPDDVFDKILERCGGIPLAIIKVTSLLAGKPKDEWSEDSAHTFPALGFCACLTYLGINCGNIVLPTQLVSTNQMTNLKLLQTFVVYGTLPVSIVLPTQLLCLHAATSVPNGIGKLTSLEQLRIFGNPNIFVKELGSLRELRVLRIYN